MTEKTGKNLKIKVYKYEAKVEKETQYETIELPPEEIVTVKVFKYDPKVDEKPYYETYRVPFEEVRKSMSSYGLPLHLEIDQILKYINDFLGGNIAWRPTFPIMVNGLPGGRVLGYASGKSFREAEYVSGGDELTLEPLPILPVIKDLVVDLEKLYKIRDRLSFYHQSTRPYPGELHNPITIPNYIDEYMPAQVNACLGVQCAACLAACPMVQNTWRDFVGPLYFVKLVKYLIHPEDRGDRVGTAFREGVFNCTMCGKCEKACPYDIEIPDIVLERLRRNALDAGLEPLPGHTEFTNLVSATGRVIPSQGVSLTKQLPDLVDVEKPQKEIALFTGCLIDNKLQNVGLALINVLKENNIRVHIPKTQECCGSPLFRNGQPELARNFVHRNTRVFEALPVDIVVTVCSECGFTLKKDYPKVLGREPEFKVMDITEFLAKEVKLKTEKMRNINLTATFSDPCNLKTGQQIYEEPRKVLKKIPGLKLIEMERSDACCGAGGALRLTRKDLSDIVAKKKGELIGESGAQAVVITCPWCQLNIEEGLQNIPEEKRPKVLNLTEILEMAYK